MIWFLITMVVLGLLGYKTKLDHDRSLAESSKPRSVISTHVD